MQDQLVEFEGIVVDFADLQLPGTNVIHVIKHMLKPVKVNERSLDLLEVPFPSSRKFGRYHPSAAGTIRPQCGQRHKQGHPLITSPVRYRMTTLPRASIGV
jgi:hypothetical protein